MADEKQHSATVDVETDVKPVEKPKQGHEADEAFNAIEELQGEAIDLDSGTNKRLLRITDWHLMPIMCFIYGMNFLDSMFAFRFALRIMHTDDGGNNTLTPVSWASRWISISKETNINGWAVYSTLAILLENTLPVSSSNASPWVNIPRLVSSSGG